MYRPRHESDLIFAASAGDTRDGLTVAEMRRLCCNTGAAGASFPSPDGGGAIPFGGGGTPARVDICGTRQQQGRARPCNFRPKKAKKFFEFEFKPSWLDGGWCARDVGIMFHNDGPGSGCARRGTVAFGSEFCRNDSVRSSADAAAASIAIFAHTRVLRQR